jgi:precorrin-4 methylase
MVSGNLMSTSMTLPIKPIRSPSNLIMRSLVVPPGLPAAAADSAGMHGKLYLVGMGPGDAELVTFKAAKLLKDADCVFCFCYLKDEVARYAPPAKIKVASPLLMGRVCGRNLAELPPERRKELEQSKEELSQFVEKVRNLVAAGKTVVIADAGDPAVYCPWSWITDEFADLQPIVVPGLSSFSAANAALGQSITQYNGSVLISGGEDLGASDKSGRLKLTLVLFTYHAKLNELVPRLRAHYPADTPMAVVCEASYPTQRVVWGTLATILERTANEHLPHLYLIYAGDGLKAPVASPIV